MAARERRKPEVMAVRWLVTITDTFGGEANYSWVQKHYITLPEGATRRQVVMAAKKVAGWAGWDTRTESWGDGYALYPRRAALVMFIDVSENQDDASS